MVLIWLVCLGVLGVLIHMGRAKVNISVKCFILVKMYGNRPKKLFVKIIRNNYVRMNEFPLFSLPFLRIITFSPKSLPFMRKSEKI
jgi:hypothetical protein